MRTAHELTVDDAGLAIICSPRDDLVREELISEGSVDAGDGSLLFGQVEGAFVRYRRRVTVSGQDDDGTRVHESFDFQIPPGAWRFLTRPLLAHGLRSTSLSRRPPWWAPTQRMGSPRAFAVLGQMATLAFVVGYLSNLIASTMTFAADEFDASNTAQGVVLSSVRLGGFLAIGLSVLADRRGRQRLLLVSILISILATAAGAITPNLAGLGATQAVSRGATTAGTALLGVVLAEEMPKGARAWALGQITMSGGVGAGLGLVLLPLAETGEQGWRLLYALPLLVVPPLLYHLRRVPETQRFAQPHTEVPVRSRASRFWLVAGLLFLLNVFAAPTSQFRNEFLRDERSFDAGTISMFVIVSGGVAAIGIVMGGRLAEAWGRRAVGAGAAILGATAITASFILGGPAMWVTATVGMTAAAALIPSTGVYGAELFPTSMRSGANGTAGAVAMGGSVVGLLTVGVLADRMGSFGPAVALVGIAPILAALMILLWFPETARRELEELNPEDKVEDDRSGDRISGDGEALPADDQAQPEDEIPSGEQTSVPSDHSSGAGSRT